LAVIRVQIPGGARAPHDGPVVEVPVCRGTGRYDLVCCVMGAANTPGRACPAACNWAPMPSPAFLLPVLATAAVQRQGRDAGMLTAVGRGSERGSGWAVGGSQNDGEGRGMQPLTSDDPAEIGGYRLQGRLGTGGMAQVYLASTSAGRLVALKVMRPELSDDQEFRARFRQEIQAARLVHGLYTAQLLYADPAATPPWLVTAYVPGPSLEEAIDTNGPMPAAMVLRLIAGVAEALQAIHAADIVHRDLKPSNVLLAQDGPRVIDFGIARALEATALTSGNIMMGSPDFLTPEQILDMPISPAIDVFALGSLAVYAAVGRPPFGHGHVTAVSHRVVYEPPDLEGCPSHLLTLIEACLEKDPKLRPAPARIIEFCAAHAAEMSDSSQPWREWSLAGAVPEPSEGSPGAAVALTGFAQLGKRLEAPHDDPGGNAGDASAGKANRRRLRFVAAMTAAAVAAALIATVVTLQFTTVSNTALGDTAARRITGTRRPVTPAVRNKVQISSPAPSPVAASAPSPARSQAPSEVAAPVVLLSQGHPATASSVQGYPWAAANAVDGNSGTRWSSAWSDPQWLEVDLGATHAIRKVVLDWEWDAYATAFQIQVSDNGTTWTDIYSTTAGTGGDQTLQVSGTGRYVRMYGTHRVSGYGYSLWEFQVFGS
jgi:serine/threonine protein kinase